MMTATTERLLARLQREFAEVSENKEISEGQRQTALETLRRGIQACEAEIEARSALQDYTTGPYVPPPMRTICA